jgi:hypothetical protein
MQGFRFGKPMSLSEITERLAQQARATKAPPRWRTALAG